MRFFDEEPKRESHVVEFLSALRKLEGTTRITVKIIYMELRTKKLRYQHYHGPVGKFIEKFTIIRDTKDLIRPIQQKEEVFGAIVAATAEDQKTFYEYARTGIVPLKI